MVTGRYIGADRPSLSLTGLTRTGEEWSTRVDATVVDDPSLTAVWARAHLRDLEDRYASGDTGLEKQIAETSLRYGVLCRFTAWLAVDHRIVADGGPQHRVLQPVEPVAGWDMPAAESFMAPVAMAAPMAPMMMAPARASRARLAGPTGAGRSAGVARRPSEPKATAAALAVVEADRMRAAAGAPLAERRELLADLGTRLGALLRQLPDSSGRLRALVDALTGDQALRVPRRSSPNSGTGPWRCSTIWPVDPRSREPSGNVSPHRKIRTIMGPGTATSRDHDPRAMIAAVNWASGGHAQDPAIGLDQAGVEAGRRAPQEEPEPAVQRLAPAA